jgi:four helix bundle protein
MKYEKEGKDLKNRTRGYALRIINLYSALPGRNPAKVIANQLLRSGTSVGANYSEAVHARSDADFINKHEICLQELEETMYWLDLLTDANIVKVERIEPLKTKQMN